MLVKEIVTDYKKLQNDDEFYMKLSYKLLPRRPHYHNWLIISFNNLLFSLLEHQCLVDNMKVLPHSIVAVLAHVPISSQSPIK